MFFRPLNIQCLSNLRKLFCLCLRLYIQFGYTAFSLLFMSRRLPCICIFLGRPGMPCLVWPVVIEFRHICFGVYGLFLGMFIQCTITTLLVPRLLFPIQSLYLAHAWAWVILLYLRILRPRFSAKFQIEISFLPHAPCLGQGRIRWGECSGVCCKLTL